MRRTAIEEELREQFGQFYLQSHLDVNQRIEQAVCGCDYGGVSWATRSEIDDVNARLALAPGDRLLDLGAGSGWPGLYMGGASGCDVTLVDLPAEGLAVALERVAREPLSGTLHVAVADGQSLPFAAASFDAITHSDVLCCLYYKEAVLADCRRVIKDAGQMIFSVISIASNLSAEGRRRANEIGPPLVDAPMEYDEMVEKAGWGIERKIDRTGPFLKSAALFRSADLEAREDLAKLLGEEDLAGRLARDEALVDAIETGLLRRDLYQVRPA